MKSLLKSLSVAAMFLSFSGQAQKDPANAPAVLKESATSASAAKHAFVDMQTAILQTEEGKKAKANIEKEAESKRSKLLAQQNDLKKLDEEYQAQQSVLSEEAKATKQKDFQNKLQGLRQAQMNFEQEVRAKEAQETQKIIQKLAATVEEVAKKKGFDLVFEKGSGAVVYASNIVDITPEVVASFNAKSSSASKSTKKN